MLLPDSKHVENRFEYDGTGAHLPHNRDFVTYTFSLVPRK